MASLNQGSVHLSCAGCGVAIRRSPSTVGERNYCTAKCYRASGASRPRTSPRRDKGSRKVPWVAVKCGGCGKDLERPPWAVSPTNYCTKNCYKLNGAAKTGGGRPRVRTTEYKVVSGYIVWYKPGHPMASKSGWVAEHRMVAAENLGRLLTKDEHVHHLNHDRADNRWENLEVMPGKAHMKLTARERLDAVDVAFEKAWLWDQLPDVIRQQYGSSS